MMSNSVPESEKEILTGYVSFYTQWFDVCVCIRVRGLHLVLLEICPSPGQPAVSSPSALLESSPFQEPELRTHHPEMLRMTQAMWTFKKM